MMNYMDEINDVAGLNLPWDKMAGKTVLITGASGMIGSFLIQVLMTKKLGIKIIALGRNRETARQRFSDLWDSPYFTFISHDINQSLMELGDIDFIIHAASNTHPKAYAGNPIGTMTTNIFGTYHLLMYASMHRTERFLLASSVEVYGENRGDTTYFDEQYCGYIDCNTLRAGYPESKRASEALCQAFIQQHGLDIVIARLSRTYGPTMLGTDTKAISQFIKNGVAKENITLKSAGTQFYSYNYVADSVSGLLTVLLKGINGNAYNIADQASDITLKDLALLIADYRGTRVVFEEPEATEAIGYSKATKAILDADKLRKLGWSSHWGIKAGIERTIDLLSENQKQNL